jgi:Uma2 family endonuclease
MVVSTKTLPQQQPEPAWDIARLFPNQGQWTEIEYLTLSQSTNHLVEFTDGHIEVLAMPKMSHQLIVAYLYGLLSTFVTDHDLGRVLFAPLRVRLRQGVVREPDIVLMLKGHASRMGEDCWDGADLVIEVVSDDLESRRRDLEVKYAEYADSGIPEYWIIDPVKQQITVFALEGKQYSIYSEAGSIGRVTSKLMSKFEIDSASLFAAGTI